MYEMIIEGPAKNALGMQLMGDLRKKLDEADGQPLLLTGAGDSFSAGLNLLEVASLDPAGMEAFLRALEDLACAIFDYPAPTVAAVNGHAIAGGCILALCCDHRVGAAGARAKIGLNELALGLRFPPRILRVLRHQLTDPKAAPAILSAALHGPEGALAAGLLDELADDAVETGRKRLDALAKIPAEAYAASKVDLHAGVATLDAEAERRFMDEVIPVWTSDAVKARVRAILGK